MSPSGSVAWSRARLGPDGPNPLLDELLADPPATVAQSLAAARRLGPLAAVEHEPLRLWELLATAGAADLEVARTLEPHLDALAILREAGAEPGAGPDDAARGESAASWGVFAAEGPGARLSAEESDGRWTLRGVKPWCSLAGVLDRALVTAWIDDDRRALFAVELRRDDVEVDDRHWFARGLVDIPSGPVTFSGTPATPVGEPGWYLTRPGFSWGGIGVAACWYGGAVGLARTLHAACAARPGRDLVDMHLGRVDEALTAARLALVHAADEIVAGRASGDAGKLLAARVRGIVAAAAETVLGSVAHALGPAPLATDLAHARRVADLQLYVRQHHAEVDQASLGRRLAASAVAPW